MQGSFLYRTICSRSQQVSQESKSTFRGKIRWWAGAHEMYTNIILKGNWDALRDKNHSEPAALYFFVVVALISYSMF